MRSLRDQTIKQAIKASILIAEARRWSYHMARKPELQYKERTVQFDSSSHLKLLKSTLEHLVALRNAYAAGSANRHVISQTCTRIKRLIAKLEQPSE
jgi:hypothetical protein